MAIRGERFELNLDGSDDDDNVDPSHGPSAKELPVRDSAKGGPSSGSAFGALLVNDVLERQTGVPQPPKAPQLQGARSGFPAHKRREDRRAQHASAQAPPSASSSSDVAREKALRSEDSKGLTERQSIDQENAARMAHMSAEQIEKEREELLANLNPSLIQRLLKRATIDDPHSSSVEPDRGSEAQGIDEDVKEGEPTDVGQPLAAKPKKVAFEAQDSAASRLADRDSDLNVPHKPPDDLDLPTSKLAPSNTNMHFPKVEVSAETLDPTSSNFLSELHKHYFADLPSNPHQMAWMAPLPTEASSEDGVSPYNPSQEALSPAVLRFNFRGQLIPPRLARQIPVTKGLHHHGEAPEAAGYTLPELGLLARSTVPAQRCIAYQTLGRVLYRLGIGQFGAPGNEGEDLADGLWRTVESEHILDVLINEAAKDEGRGHASARAFATEAVWLWRKGGGKRMQTT